MPDDEYIAIADPSISNERRAWARAGVFRQLASYHDLTQPRDVKWCISALQRKLYAIGALPAEEGWRDSEETSAHRDAIWIEVRPDGGDDPSSVRYGRKRDKWFLFHDSSGAITHYMQISDDSGRTTSVRPPDVRDEAFIELWCPAETPIRLRNFLEKLTSQLDPENADDIPFIDAQERRRPSLLAMYAPDRKFSNEMPLTDGFRGILSSIFYSPFEPVISNISSNHTNFLIDGGLGGQLCLSILALAVAYAESIGPDSINPTFPYSVHSFREILERLAAHPEGTTWILKASEAMQVRGEELQLSALEADSVGGVLREYF